MRFWSLCLVGCTAVPKLEPVPQSEVVAKAGEDVVVEVGNEAVLDARDSTEGDTSAHATNNDQTGITGGILQDSGVAGYDGSSKRRLLVDSDATVSSPVASTGEETESVTL